MTLSPFADAQSTAFIKNGSCPWINGSPPETSNAQYPIGTRTWLSLQKVRLMQSKIRQALPRCSNSLEVCFCNESIPMVLQDAGSCGVGLKLAERPLINNTGVSCVVKQGRSYPWLKEIAGVRTGDDKHRTMSRPQVPTNRLNWRLELSWSHKGRREPQYRKLAKEWRGKALQWKRWEGET